VVEPSNHASGYLPESGVYAYSLFRALSLPSLGRVSGKDPFPSRGPGLGDTLDRRRLD